MGSGLLHHEVLNTVTTWFLVSHHTARHIYTSSTVGAKEEKSNNIGSKETKDISFRKKVGNIKRLQSY
jgi:hypothetical protein